MPSLITQTIDQRPVVLLFSTATSLAPLLISSLEQKNIEVVQRPLASLFAEGRALEKELQPVRILVVANSLEELQKIELKELAKELVVVAGYQVCRAEENLIWKSQKDVAQHLINTFQARLILGAELLLSTSKPSFTWQKVLAETSSAESLRLPLTAVDQFCAQVVRLLFQPHPSQTYLVWGQSQPFPAQLAPSSQVLETQLDAAAKSVELPSASLDKVQQAVEKYLTDRSQVPQVVEKATAEPTQASFLVKKGSVGPLAPWKLQPGQAPVASAGIDLSLYGKNVRTTPILMPRVANRQRVYEQRKHEMERQQQLKKRLETSPPVISKLNKNSKKHGVPDPKMSEAEVDQVVQSLFKPIRDEHALARRQTKVGEVVVVKEKSRRLRVATVLSGMVLGLLVFSMCLGGVFLASGWLLQKQFSELLQTYQRLSPTERFYRAEDIKKLSQLVATQTEAYALVLGDAQLTDTRRQAEIVHAFALAVSEERALQEQASLAAEIFLGQKAGDFFEQYLSLSQVMQQQYQQLSLVTSHLQTLRDAEDSDSLPPELEAVSAQVQEMRRAAVSSQQLDSYIPALLAQKGRRTYAVVVQNSQELRPSGGLVESVALLTVDNGQLISSSVYDVSKLDSLSAGTIAPPPELQTYLGQQRLLLRDSSWFADGPTAAAQMRRQVETSTNTSINGVILLTTPALQNLISAIGPVTVEAYDEEVTDKNLATKLEFHSELQLTDQAKEPYSTALTRAVIKKVFSSPDNLLKSLATLYQQLRNADVAFVPTDASEEAVMSGLGWNGEVATPSCPNPFDTEHCQVDTIYQVEANIGVNRANVDMSRDIADQVVLTDDSVQHHRTVALKNSSANNAWPSGDYKAYLRFFLPNTAKEVSVMVNGQSVALQTDRTETASFSQKVVGFVVRVPLKSTSTVELQYSLPRFRGNDYAYAFFDQKQPGVGEAPWRLTILNQTGLRPVQVAPAAKISGQTIRFEATQDKHQFVGVAFSR